MPSLFLLNVSAFLLFLLININLLRLEASFGVHYSCNQFFKCYRICCRYPRALWPGHTESIYNAFYHWIHTGGTIAWCLKLQPWLTASSGIYLMSKYNVVDNIQHLKVREMDQDWTIWAARTVPPYSLRGFDRVTNAVTELLGDLEDSFIYFFIFALNSCLKWIIVSRK